MIGRPYSWRVEVFWKDFLGAHSFPHRPAGGSVTVWGLNPTCQDAVGIRMAPAPPSSFRVLCLVLHPCVSGHAVLDGFGVPEKSLFSTRHLVKSGRARFVSLRILLRRSLRKYRPQAVVLGIGAVDNRIARDLRREARRIARAARVNVVTRWLRDGRLLLTGRARLGVERLAEMLANGFVPAMDSDLRLLKKNPWYRGEAWNALSLALVELVHRKPRTAAALASPAGRAPSFWRAVALAELSRHPLPV